MGIFDKLKRKKSKEEQEIKAANVDNGGKVAKEVEKKSDAKAKDDSKPAKPSKPAKAKPLGDAHAILLSPMLTEKTFKLQQQNKYAFFIRTDANKYQVKAAMREIYGINPVSVNIQRKRAVAKKRWGRTVGMIKSSKKAIVTMPEGTVLNLTE